MYFPPYFYIAVFQFAHSHVSKKIIYIYKQPCTIASTKQVGTQLST